MGSLMLRPVVRLVWRLKRESASMLRWVYYASLPGAFFKSLGWGTRFFGKVRFGSVEGNIKVGRNCWMGHEVFLSAARGGFIVIEDGVSLNTGCHVVAVFGITIGSNARVGEYCSIRDQDHQFGLTDMPVKDQGFSGAPVKIGRDVWIGRGVFVGSGVEIGDGAVIGANSVVTKSIPAFAVAVGSPARVIHMRGETSPEK